MTCSLVPDAVSCGEERFVCFSSSGAGVSWASGQVGQSGKAMRERFMVVWSEVRTDAALECTARFSAFGLAGAPVRRSPSAPSGATGDRLPFPKPTLDITQKIVYHKVCYVRELAVWR